MIIELITINRDKDIRQKMLIIVTEREMPVIPHEKELFYFEMQPYTVFQVVYSMKKTTFHIIIYLEPCKQ